MERTLTFSPEKIKHELRQRWFMLTLIGIYLVVAVLFSFLIYGLGWNQPATRWAAQIFPLPAARVNGEVIWLSSYYRRLAIFEYYAQAKNDFAETFNDEDELERRTLDQMVENALVVQEARQAGITVTNEEIETNYAKLTAENGGPENFEKILANYYHVTPSEFSREFIPEQLYRDKIQSQLFTQVHLRYIIIRDEKQARDVLEKAKKGDDFTELAKNFSEDTKTRDTGGDSGWIRRGQLDKAIEDAALGLQTNQLHQDLVSTSVGFVIIRVDERKDAAISDKSFPEWLESLKQQARTVRYVAKPIQPTNP